MSVSLNDFNIDLLANVLSYIDVSDIRNCWIVNKKFALIISTKLHFWKRQSDYALIRYAKKHLIMHFSHLFHFFDPFYIKGESLKSQMRWIFDFKKIVISCEFFIGNDTILIHKQHDNCKWTRFRILYKSKKLYAVSVFNSVSHLLENGVLETFYTDGRRTVGEYLKCCIVKANGYVPSECAFWNGEVYEKEPLYIPHGKGTWTFDDGRISEGAEHGKPIIK